MDPFTFLGILMVIQILVSIFIILKNRQYFADHYNRKALVMRFIWKLIIFVALLIIVYSLSANGWDDLAWVIVGIELFLWIVGFILYLSYGVKMAEILRKKYHKK